MSDNVFPSEIIQICSLVSRQVATPSLRTLGGDEEQQQIQKSMEDVLVQTIAERIVDYAQACMSNRKRVSPFERAAAREGQYFRGGVSFILYTMSQY